MLWRWLAESCCRHCIQSGCRRCLTRQPATDLLSPRRRIYFQRNRWCSVPATCVESPCHMRLQFAYRPNRSIRDAISHVLHSSLTHIDSKNGNYVRLLFIDYRSAFNTTVPIKLAFKLTDLGLNYFILNYTTLRLDSKLSHWQTSSGESRPVHLKLHHPEHRSPPELCPESPALLSLHTTVCPLTAPLLLSNLLMILWFWASFPTMMRPHTWMR